MRQRQHVRGAITAMAAVMICTLAPGIEPLAAERAVRQPAERSATAGARRAERKRARPATAPRPAEARESAPAKSASPEVAKDDAADWISIYPAEQ